MYLVTHDQNDLRVVSHVQLRKLVHVQTCRIKFQRSTRTLDIHTEEMYPKDHLEKDGTLIFFVNYPTNEHWVFVAAYGKPSSGVITIEVRSDNQIYAERDNAHVAKCVALALTLILESRLKTVKFKILLPVCVSLTGNSCAIHVICQSILFRRSCQERVHVDQKFADRIRSWIISTILDTGSLKP